VQDTDVLDTWFSSALWPFSVFGWPEQTADLKFFYPTTALVTGYEILYLWVARMQMMGLRFLNEVPFSHVYIHGIVRDRHGKKMSKSLGNVIDPLTMMDKYGTDAMRFALAAQSKAGKDIPFSDDMLVGARNFANKLWNTARFVLMYLPPQASGVGLSASAQTPEAQSPTLELCDRWILQEYRAMVREVRAHLDDYDPASAADAIYGFVWDRFCDWYLELAKIRLMGTDEAAKDVPRAILVEVLDGVLKLLHPFMPYITEECWQAMKPYTGEKTPFALHAHLPLAAEAKPGADAGAMQVVMDVTRAIRTIRSQFNVSPALQLDAVVSGADAPALKILNEHGAYVRHLARLKDIRSESNGRKPPHSATAVVAGLKLFIPLEGIIDLEKEKARLKKETDGVHDEMGKLDVKLGREDFRSRAPKAEVDRTLARKAELEAKLKEIETHLADL
jgi:valyl-tRNA synthetase